MAGNIPPLVSSTPPPLNAFDDEEEEEEDEFGLYNTADDLEYNDCMSYKEKDEERPNTSRSREHDSTSQDSATDSGLCPDSEGMSPTPHSDEERPPRPNTSELPSGGVSERQETPSVHCGSNPSPVQTLSNGHVKEDSGGQESDDDFGNFEFASSQKDDTLVEEVKKDFENDVFPSFQKVETSVDEVKECIGEGNLKGQSPLSTQQYSLEHKVNGVLNTHLDSDKLSEKEDNSEEISNEFYVPETNLDELVVEEPVYSHASEEVCKYEQSTVKNNEFTIDKFDIASSNDSSSFNSVDSSSEPKLATSSDPQKDGKTNEDSTTEISNEDFKCAIDYREENENNIPDKNNEDDEFDEFTDFKAEFPGCDDLSRSEQGDQSNEHSKAFAEPTKPENAVLSLPPSQQEESDDEFSNFADFSSSDCAFVSAQSSNSLENVSHIPLKLDDSDLRTESEFQDWVSVFPTEDSDTSLVTAALLRQDDVVWSRLFPLESSPALSYQWNESLSNRRLLSALNIDSRNILFTPWNVSAVPRFAANLSCGPLEPIKAAEAVHPAAATPTTAATAAAPTPAPASATQESVPDAHFDWVGSGLTNPLDCPKTVLNLPKVLSAEAEKVLSSLPDISYMRKTYIDFPIGEA